MDKNCSTIILDDDCQQCIVIIHAINQKWFRHIKIMAEREREEKANG